MFTVTAWNNGGSGYGLRIRREDRRPVFSARLRSVTIDLPNGQLATANLTSTFGRHAQSYGAPPLRQLLRQNGRDSWRKASPSIYLGPNWQGLIPAFGRL
jgi:hypothetical protein